MCLPEASLALHMVGESGGAAGTVRLLRRIFLISSSRPFGSCGRALSAGLAGGGFLGWMFLRNTQEEEEEKRQDRHGVGVCRGARSIPSDDNQRVLAHTGYHDVAETVLMREMFIGQNNILHPPGTVWCSECGETERVCPHTHCMETVEGIEDGSLTPPPLSTSSMACFISILW
ncbi:hypothetical protein EYF80_041711 [Liparis tanakae]|uniref:Uncharacterized protein n=1 Tax=Liparis tanakae TaxID=230148 RepID=A0A4Z2G3D7_9TELE|nr:hypothetical protein EYF80_041711 [Liparis tanakae]